MDNLKSQLKGCHNNAAALVNLEQRLRMCVDHLIGVQVEHDRRDEERGEVKLPEAVIETLAYVNAQQQNTILNIASLIAQIEEAVGIHSDHLATKSVGRDFSLEQQAQRQVPRDNWNSAGRD